MIPDTESVLVHAAQDQFTTARVCTDLPADLADVLPVIQVDVIGGQDLQVAVDRATVDFDCYGLDRIAARALAHQVWDWLRFTLPGSTVDGALISRVNTINQPNWVPYDDTNVRRFTFTVQVYLRAT